MSKKHLYIFVAALCIIGLGVTTPRPANSATCSSRTIPLNSAVATGPIPVSLGLKYFPVNNQSPFKTGMRIRALTGKTLRTTKYVEGQVGRISQCNIAVLVDRVYGSGTMFRASFVVAGEIGAQGPIGDTGASGPMGLQGQPGTNGTDGTNGTNGTNGFVPAYGSFSDTTTQQIDAINTPKAMTFNQITPGVNGVSASGVSVEFGSHIVVARTGTYNVQLSAQLAKTDPGNDIMSIWLRQNGIDVPLSNSDITITASLRQVATSNYIIDLVAGDYIQLMYSSADIATQILAVAPQTSPVRPAGPSITVAITQVQ